MWPSPELSEIAVRRLRAHGFAHPFEHVRYDGAGHTIATPWRPTTVRARRHPVIGQVFSFGGTPLANARACEDSWRRVLELLGKTFGSGQATN